MAQTIFDCRHLSEAIGVVDESIRSFSPDEKTIADRHAAEGHVVRAVPAAPKYGRTADSDICGVQTEFKTIQPGGTAPPASRVRNSIGRRRGQGTHLVVDATADPRIDQHHADLGVRMAISDETRDKAAGDLVGDEREAIRVYGRDFDISYDRTRLQEMRREQSKAQQQSAGTPEAQSGEHRDEAREARREDQKRSDNRFAIERSPERAADHNRGSRRDFRISRGDEGKGQGRRPAK